MKSSKRVYLCPDLLPRARPSIACAPSMKCSRHPLQRRFASLSIIPPAQDRTFASYRTNTAFIAPSVPNVVHAAHPHALISPPAPYSYPPPPPSLSHPQAMWYPPRWPAGVRSERRSRGQTCRVLSTAVTVSLFSLNVLLSPRFSVSHSNQGVVPNAATAPHPCTQHYPASC